VIYIFNPKDAKKSARALERFLRARGLELKLGEAYEALSVLSGHANWAALSKKLTEDSFDRELRDFEKAHMFGAEEADLRAEETGQGGYGLEDMIVVHTGFQLRYPRYTDEDPLLDYVRVCDPLGREIAYWSSDEWRDDPQLVMGAILGALARGRPVEVPATSPRARQAKVAKQDPRTEVAATASTPKQYRIQDVNFFDVSAVMINGEYFRLRYHHAEETAKLKDLPLADANEPDDTESQEALGLGREEDGLVFEESVSLATLRRLIWDPAGKAFVDPQTQDTYQFILAVYFGT